MTEQEYLLELKKNRKNYPLDLKILLSKKRVREWYEHWNGNVYVAFSGGKDSTVLLDLVRSEYPKVPAVFVNTGLEFPEIIKFVRRTKDVAWLKPKLSFKEVLTKYGFPVVSKEVSQKIYEARTTKSEKLLNKRLYGDNNKYKSGKIPNKWQYLIKAPFKISHKCCDIMKKNPSKKFKASVLLGNMAEDSHLRYQNYIQRGCNAFEGKIQSTPIAFWTNQDIWEYISKKGLDYSTIYEMGYPNTGCVFCCFGVHLDKEENKFQLMKKTHPKLWKYCMGCLNLKEILTYLKIKYE